MEKLKAVIYIRVSDQSQIDNNSLETQLKACKQYADTNSYEVVDIYREEGVSAKHTYTRPELKEMISYCTNRKNLISAVIVYKMDRWTRNTEEGLAVISLLSKYGVALLPATEIDTQDAMGKAMRTILMTLAELDNNIKGERVRDNMKTMFRNGYWCWKPRIGYKRPFKTKEENKGKSVIIDERLGEIVKAIFVKATEVSVSKKALAEYANSLGFEQIYGKKADGRTISRIIGDSFYYGYMYVEKWKEYAWGKYEPLVSEDIWQKANINVFGRSKKYKHQDNTLFPLKGFLNCKSCEHPLTSSNPKGTNKQYLYYECHNPKCIKHHRIGLENAHKSFLDELARIRPSNRVLKLFSALVFDEWDKGIENRKREASILDKQITNLEHRITAIAESNAKKILTDEEAQHIIDDVRKELAVLKIERSDIRIDQYDNEAVRNFTEAFILNIDKLWQQIDLSHKQELQREIFVHNLIVENGKIRTSGLAPTFSLIESLATENSENVTPREFESRFPG